MSKLKALFLKRDLVSDVLNEVRHILETTHLTDQTKLEKISAISTETRKSVQRLEEKCCLIKEKSGSLKTNLNEPGK